MCFTMRGCSTFILIISGEYLYSFRRVLSNILYGSVTRERVEIDCDIISKRHVILSEPICWLNRDQHT